MNDQTMMTSDGVELSLRVDLARADATDPPLLLLNSLGTNLSMWDAHVPRWSAARSVVRFDQRGHGRSGVGEAPYDVHRLGQDAVEVLDHLGIDHAHVCGLSLGGLVGLWLLVEHPARFDRAVLADTAARIGTEDAWEARAAAVERDGMEAITELVLSRFFSPSFLSSEDPVVDRLRATLAGTVPDGYAASCRALAVADLRDRAREVRAPTLVVVGTADEATPPAAARELHAAIDGSALHLIDGAGHLANLERPDEFTAVVADWLAGGSRG